MKSTPQLNQGIQTSCAKLEKRMVRYAEKKSIENRGDRAITKRGMSNSEKTNAYRIPEGGGKGWVGGRTRFVGRRRLRSVNTLYITPADTPASTRYSGETPQPRRSSTRFLVWSRSWRVTKRKVWVDIYTVQRNRSVDILGSISGRCGVDDVAVKPQAVFEGEGKRELWAESEEWLVPLDIFNSWPVIRGEVEAVLDVSSSEISPSSRLSWSVTAVIDDGVWSSSDCPFSRTASAGFRDILSVMLEKN